ncbi:hypothetical protein EDC04DRAFT_2916334 [Pisolithus marmoratus]|nr:hypothetical protein EDC04DRAFT_2916334 [Pisolithus marmoratus]
MSQNSKLSSFHDQTTDEVLYEVEEITAEKLRKYRVKSSNSLSVPPSSRRTRRSGASEPSPQIPSEDEHPTHASTSHIKKEQSAKRKRKSSSETRRAVSRNDMDEREGSSRPRKKRKIGIEVRITTPPKRGVYSANGNGNTYKGARLLLQPRLGSPAGAKASELLWEQVKGLGGTSEDAPMLPLTIAHLPKPERRPTSKRTFIREPILSPGAIARLELFDRVMASSSDGDHGDTDASASTEPSHKRLKRTPHKSHRNTIETLPAMGSSKQHSPQKTSASKLIKAMLPKLDSDEDSSSNDSDRNRNRQPRPSPKAHRGTSRTVADGSPSRRIDIKQRPGSSSTSSLVLPRPTNGKAAGKNKEVDSLDLPEIAVIPERSSTTPFDELPSSPPVKTKHVNLHPHPAMKPVPQISPNTFKTKLKLVGPGNAVSSEAPPSSIESFASPQLRRPFIRKQLSTGAARKTVPLSTAEQSSEEDVEQDDEDRHQENANEARPKGRPTDSEVRKRGKELFDEQQRKRDAKRAVAAQSKRLKPLANIMGRLKSAKEMSPIAGASYNEGVAADDCLDSVVQEMEDAYVDLSGKTQSATMETSAPNNTVQKSWATMTAEEREALRIQLRQEEEENTQEAIHVPAPAVQDSGTYTY